MPSRQKGTGVTSLRLELFGGVRLLRGDRILSEPASRKARGLLVYLALQEGRTVMRDYLAALLWSRSDQERSRHSLSQAVSSIRRAFDEAELCGLNLGREWISLDPTILKIDARDFEKLAASSLLSSLRQAAALYRGELLEGLHINEPRFQAWQHHEQSRFKEAAIKLFSKLMETEAANGSTDNAIAAALKLVSIDELNEQAHRTLMRLYSEQGRSNDALRQFSTLEWTLKRELAAQPEAETRRLRQKITQRRMIDPARHGKRPHSGLEESAAPSIVVLPFCDYSDDPDALRFADGLTDDLINDLSRISGLLVIARGTSFAYKNRAVDVQRLSRHLGVRYVLEGSVRRVRNKVRVNVQFIDGVSGTQLWSGRFDRDLENVLLLQNEITSRIAAALRLEFLRAEGRRARVSPPKDLTAWSLALSGWAELWTKPMNRRTFATAMPYIQKALELDPSHSLAWTAMSRLHFNDGLRSFGSGGHPGGVSRRRDSFKRAVEAAKNAINLDPNSAEAHAELASALKTQKKYDEATVACETALRLNPNYEEAYIYLATVKKDIGKPEDSLRLLDRSFGIAPHLPTDSRRNYFIAWAHLLAGQHENALTYANRSLTFDNKFSSPHWIRACVFGWQGQTEAAADALSSVDATDPVIGNIEAFANQYQHVTGNDYVIEGLLRAGMRER